MGLREDALAAAEAARAARVDTARARLAAVLAPADVTELQVAHLDDTVVVFTDDAEVCLSVAAAGNPPVVRLVHGQDTDWTVRGPVSSLAELGTLLPAGDA